MVIGVDSEMAPAAGVGGAGYAMVFSRRLWNSFVRLLDQELCPFQVRGGGVGHLSSSSIVTAMWIVLEQYGYQIAEKQETEQIT